MNQYGFPERTTSQTENPIATSLDKLEVIAYNSLVEIIEKSPKVSWLGSQEVQSDLRCFLRTTDSRMLSINDGLSRDIHQVLPQMKTVSGIDLKKLILKYFEDYTFAAQNGPASMS